MAQLRELVQYLDGLLVPGSFRDSALNGLQVEAGATGSQPASQQAAVSLVACAVDAAESTIVRAAEHGAQLLIVHHGLFWGKEQALTGSLGRKIELLMKNGLSLYASHLPLDGNMSLGNNVELARYFDVSDIVPFCEHHGSTIGCSGRFSPARPIEKILEKARELVRSTPTEKAGLPFLLPFGPHVIERVGFVSGSGSLALGPAAHAGLDLLISGESKHEAYHQAKELGINALFCGHYRTETFGVSAIRERLEKEFNLSTVFIEEDTGI